MFHLIEIIAKLEMKYVDNITSVINIKNYFKTRDNNIWKLISEVKI